MKEIKKKKSKPDPKILIPVIVGAVCVLMIAVVVIFMNPESTTAGQLQKKLELGDKYLESGDYEKAELAFQEALKIDEKSPDATIKLADTYNKMKKPEKALKMLEQTNKNLENMSGTSAFHWISHSVTNDLKINVTYSTKDGNVNITGKDADYYSFLQSGRIEEKIELEIHFQSD